MALVDFAANTLTLNVVYFGPRGAGCGTNVRQLHRNQPTRERVELRRVGGEDKKERIWHFALRMDQAPKLGGLEVMLRVASVPSGPDLTLDRDLFLDGVDGIVFVADARANRAEDNLAAMLDLERSLLRFGVELQGVPLVFLVNQTDAANARPAARVLDDLNRWGARAFEGMARQGKGVSEASEAIRQLVLARFGDSAADGQVVLPLTTLPAALRESGEQAVIDHAATLPQADGTRLADGTRRGLAASADVVLRPPELFGADPLGVVRAEVAGGRLRVELLVRRDDGTVRKVTLLVEPGRDDGTPIPEAEQSAPSSAVAPSTSSSHRVSAEGDLSGLTYGVIGALGGLISGVLIGYLWFVG